MSQDMFFATMVTMGMSVVVFLFLIFIHLFRISQYIKEIWLLESKRMFKVREDKKDA